MNKHAEKAPYPKMANDQVEYTCPMHPQIVQIGPGTCPICGMALEPRTVTIDNPENQELQQMTRRFWVCAVLALPLLILDMGSSMFSSHLPIPWIELAIATNQRIGIKQVQHVRQPAQSSARPPSASRPRPCPLSWTSAPRRRPFC